MSANSISSSLALVPEASPQLDPEAKMNVLIAYDDVLAGQQAMRTLGNVDRKAQQLDLISATEEAGLDFFAPGVV